jgi:hypothetical protein
MIGIATIWYFDYLRHLAFYLVSWASRRTSMNLLSSLLNDVNVRMWLSKYAHKSLAKNIKKTMEPETLRYYFEVKTLPEAAAVQISYGSRKEANVEGKHGYL